MNDCIERKKAIELIQPHVKPQTVYGEGYLQAIEHATDILELMPAADVQPVKHGKDVMKVLQQLSDTCERTRLCMECGFYSRNSGMCVFADMPMFWKHEEIEKALKEGAKNE